MSLCTNHNLIVTFNLEILDLTSNVDLIPSHRRIEACLTDLVLVLMKLRIQSSRMYHAAAAPPA